MRRLILVLGTVALVAVVVIGLAQAGGGDEPQETTAFDLEQAKRELAGAPAPLAALHEQSNALLGGGPAAFDRRIDQLEGHPAVINKWASWCRPCRAEFPVFQQVATERGKEIAFLGINA
jgi:cytochrome c biogenesis protein CcmG, thiol:disulfide interchange protein DsbE